VPPPGPRGRRVRGRGGAGGRGRPEAGGQRTASGAAARHRAEGNGGRRSQRAGRRRRAGPEPPQAPVRRCGPDAAAPAEEEGRGLRVLRQAVPQQQQPDGAPPQPHGREAVPLRPLQLRLRAELQADAPHEDPRRPGREGLLPVPAVRRALQRLRHPGEAPEEGAQPEPRQHRRLHAGQRRRHVGRHQSRGGSRRSSVGENGGGRGRFGPDGDGEQRAERAGEKPGGGEAAQPGGGRRRAGLHLDVCALNRAGSYRKVAPEERSHPFFTHTHTHTDASVTELTVK
ncbi:unnamed protein product, partial [Tetraodon nigroviridis]